MVRGGDALGTARGRDIAVQSGARNGEWRTYGGDLGNTRYAPLDQINRDNFNDLEIAWRFKTDSLGPRPEYNFQSTPLMVNGRLLLDRRFAPRGRRARRRPPARCCGCTAKTKERAAKRRRGSSQAAGWPTGPTARDERILYVTPGYRLIALDAKTGVPVSSFGSRGVVDLKLDDDQEIDLVTGEVGLHAAPVVAKDTIIIGAAHLVSFSPKSKTNVKGYVRGYDVRTGKRSWIFHTIPRPGEFGAETWDDKASLAFTGNTGVWAQISVDEELGLAYLPVELPTGDFYGGHRPGNGLFGESLVAVDLKTGKRKWHYQLVHHGIWDWDIPCAPILARPHDERQDDQGGRPADQAIVDLPLRPGHRTAALADRGAAGAAVRRAAREDQPDAAIPDEAAGVRPAGRVDRRPDRLHAGAEGRGRQARVALQARADLHAADRQPVGRAARVRS